MVSSMDMVGKRITNMANWVTHIKVTSKMEIATDMELQNFLKETNTRAATRLINSMALVSTLLVMVTFIRDSGKTTPSMDMAFWPTKREEFVLKANLKMIYPMDLASCFIPINLKNKANGWTESDKAYLKLVFLTRERMNTVHTTKDIKNNNLTLKNA